jgi:ATP-binding cassette subfamily B protein
VGIGDLEHLEDEERVRAAMDTAGAKLPIGLDTPLGRWFTGGRELSGGQWQRLALARALMRAPSGTSDPSEQPAPLLTVLDEPTASLDAAAETRLFATFARLSGETAEAGGITLLVSHRFSTVRMADLIVVLADGRVAEAGPHAELLAAGGTYAQLFHLQAQAYR